MTTSRTAAVATAALAFAISRSAAADDGSLNFREAAAQVLTATPLAIQAQPTTGADAAKPADPDAPERVEYGQPGPWWGTVMGGYARGINSGGSNDGSLHFAFSTFLVKDFELVLELGGWYFDQPGPEAVGANFNTIFRWHFLRIDDLTVFGDAGAGVLWSTHPTPIEGTKFNFTPRAGVGFTHALGDDGARFIMGVRWHHVSNARIQGSVNNPGRDGVHVYVGITFPI